MCPATAYPPIQTLRTRSRPNQFAFIANGWPAAPTSELVQKAKGPANMCRPLALNKSAQNFMVTPA